MGVRREKKPRKKMGKKKKLKLVPSRLCGAKWRKWGEEKYGGQCVLEVRKGKKKKLEERSWGDGQPRVSVGSGWIP